MSDSLPPPPGSLWRLLRKVAPYFHGCRARLIGLLALAICTASIAALEPLVLKQLFDGFVDRVGLGASSRALLLLGALLLGREALAMVQDRVFWRVRLGVNFRLLEATVERLHTLPLSYHRDQSVGATMTRIERGISGAMSAFTDVLVQLFPALIYLCVSLAVMLRIDYRLSLAVLLFAPLPALIGAFAAREQTQRERSLMQRWTQIFARFNEVLSGILVVKSFAMEEQEKRRFLGGVQQANEIVLRGVGTDGRYNAAKSAVMALARLVALALGGALVMRRQITIGTLLAFVSYLGGLFQPVQALTGMYQTLRRASVALASVFGILDAQDSLGDAPHARDPGRLRGEVEFRGISFGYRPGQPVLSRVDLHVEAGEMVALVGPSGAGKSTLMALLQRLYDPDSGSILLDGQDLRELKQRSVRAQIGVVLQEGTLFSDSVRDNIAFGRPSASREEIEAAARAANADQFIRALPQGYDTLVGERAVKLSGGERQRIAIARALLRDAPILILDEATSALDAENEEQVQRALEQLTKGRTTFVIAHRLSTITQADRIIVVKDGGIHESGSHAELMRRGGYYAALLEKQASAFSSGRKKNQRRRRRTSRAPAAPRRRQSGTRTE